jgi:translation initiation factor IF-1
MTSDGKSRKGRIIEKVRLRIFEKDVVAGKLII